MKRFPIGRSTRFLITHLSLSACVCAFALRVSAQADAPDAPDAAAEQSDAQTTQPTRPTVGEDELSNAIRLRNELDAILTDDGRLAIDAGESGPTRLSSLVTRCDILINSAMNDETRALLLGSKARALAALAQFEYMANPAAAGQRRLTQLRSVADQISALDLPSAAPSADYWQLLADLADTERSNASLRSKRALAERLLDTYVNHYANVPEGAEYVADVRLSLAKLLDERGDQRGAVAELDAIGQLPADDPRQAEIERLRGRAALIGTPISFEGLSTRLDYWQSARYLGKPILVHVYSDSVPSSVAMIEPMREAIADGDLVDCTVVSLRLGEPVAGTAQPAWPVLPVDLEPGGVLERMGVDALPTLVWIDGQGRLASMGYIASVMDQAPVFTPEPDADAVEEAGADESSTDAGGSADQGNGASQPAD